jgi:hypothetical protein
MLLLIKKVNILIFITFNLYINFIKFELLVKLWKNIWEINKQIRKMQIRKIATPETKIIKENHRILRGHNIPNKPENHRLESRL